MAKVVTEVAIGAAAIGAAIAMPGIGAGLAWMTLGMQNGIIGALVGIGSSQIMAGLSQALKPNQGGLAVGVSTPIGPWSYVYGTQKVGGVVIFRESNNNTGVSGSTSNNKQLHRVYALACHPCRIGAGFQLRIDGRQVPLIPSGNDFVSSSPTQTELNITSISRLNGVVTMVLSGPMPAGTDGSTLQVRSVGNNTFNGTWTVTQPDSSDAATFTYVCGGPDATSSGGVARTTYSDYKDKIRVSFLNGTHTSTFPTLLAAGTTWGASDLCLGRTLVYVQMGYDDTVFPSSIPNVSFVIDGKSDILDPRTGARGWTRNAALCIADFLSLPAKRGGFGLAIGTDIPTAQLIAAANICDEAVALAAGGTIPRYTCDTFVSLNQTRGSILSNMLSSCGGRISYQGGQYSIFPAAWVAPTLVLTDADLVGPIDWRPRLPIRDTCNAVKGTYVSPENAWQQADVPAYMQDAEHGYVADPWLAEDQGERIFHEANFPCVGNSATAQRLEKIALLRTRYQGRGTIRCSLKAYQAVALDVIQLTHPRYTWVNKNFEVLASRFLVDKNGKAPRPYVELDIAETDSSVYDWSTTEQLTPQGYKQPNNVGVRICMPPENVTGYSGPGATINGIVYPSTVTTGADGRVQNSIYVRWTQPNDANVVFGGHIEVQWAPVAASVWSGLGKIDPSASHVFIPNVTDGAQYNLQVRAVNCAGVPSDWVLAGPVTVGEVLSSLAYSGVPVAPPGTLTAQAFSDGTAQIAIDPFTAKVGLQSVACTPSPATLGGLHQGQLYDVYYIDPNFAGGAITPVATQNPSDFLGKTGYFLIGSIVTPTYGMRYQPSAAADLGSSTTINPAAAYDNNIATDAIVVGAWGSTQTSAGPPPTFSTWTTVGDCVWSGFPSVVTSVDKTLYVTAAAVPPMPWGINGGGFTATIKASIGGTVSTMLNVSASTPEATYTLDVPAGTNLSTITVEAIVSVAAGTPGQSGSAQIEGFEIYVQ
jgi:hypothetical protein